MYKGWLLLEWFTPCKDARAAPQLPFLLARFARIVVESSYADDCKDAFGQHVGARMSHALEDISRGGSIQPSLFHILCSNVLVDIRFLLQTLLRKATG